MAENKMLKDKIATLEKQPTDFLNVDALLYSYVNTLSLDKIKETKDAIVAAVQTDNTLLKTINNALKDTDEKSSLKKMLRAIWSRRKKQLNPIYAEISNFGTVTKQRHLLSILTFYFLGENMELLETRENIFGDNIANLKHYDFSRANLSDENRILAITTV